MLMLLMHSTYSAVHKWKVQQFVDEKLSATYSVVHQSVIKRQAHSLLSATYSVVHLLQN